MARVVERGLRRTVGVPGLFATAYGNVGSSIYYALGLVAAHALGLTPLVFIFGTDVNARALRKAARLAGEEAAVHAVYVIQVPPQLSLDAGMEEEEELGRNVLEAARLGARANKVKIRTSIIRTRHAGAALVDEARERRSEVIYLDTIHAPSHEQALGPPPATCSRNAPAESSSRRAAAYDRDLAYRSRRRSAPRRSASHRSRTSSAVAGGSPARPRGA